MQTSAKIICDSVGPNQIRLTTFVLTFPRFILPEFNTHRMFSRNGASSRAIPFTKQLEMVNTHPFVPSAFNKNAKGMQGAEVVDESVQQAAEKIWLAARDAAVEQAKQLNSLGIAKQYVNRLLEPFNFTTMVVTATEYANFFALRHHHMAQPEIQEVAKQMWEAYSTQQPTPVAAGSWHLPFVSREECDASKGNWEPLIKSSVARCARVSYLNHEGKNPTQEEDFALYERLVGTAPIHASPSEHQAQALQFDPHIMKWSANFRGWVQYRQTLKGQNITTFTGPLNNV